MAEPGKPRILVAGAGALGSLYAAILSHAGFQVSILGRPWIVEAVRAEGLTIQGKLNLKANVEAYSSLGKLREKEEFQLILLTVKAYDVEALAGSLAPLAEKWGAPILCLQNGIGVEAEAAKAAPKAAIIRGVNFCGAYVERPGVVACTGVGRTVLPAWAVEAYQGAAAFMEGLRQAGFPVEATDDIEAVVWEKTLVNAGVNPFGALTGLRNGELVQVEGLRWAMAETVREGVQVARRLGVALTRNPVDVLWETVKATAENYNSMLQDVRRGRRTEIDYINGAVARLGGETGVPTPLNRLLTGLIKGLEVERHGLAV